LGIGRIFFLKKKKKINNFNYKQKYILSVMSCVRYHNIINLLVAFSLLIKNYNLKIVLALQVLDKSYFLEIKKFIKDNSLEKKVVIFSNLNINQLPKLYKNAKLYVFTSYCEVFGLTSLEAMSQRTPVIISNKSALPEINGKAAMYFNPDNIAQINDTFKRVLFDRKLQLKLIQNGLKLLNKYNNNKNIKKTINIISNLK
jgi:glycosyltransferase involved in cell wall biosynthesis